MENPRVKTIMPPIPEFEISSYEPVEIVRPVLKISDVMVDERIKSMMADAPKEYVATKRKIAGARDHVDISIRVLKDGEPLQGLCNEHEIHTIGDGFMPLDFDRKIMGMNPGEEREFDFDAPDFDDPEAKVRSFHAQVTLNAIVSEKDPELTDEWVKRNIIVCGSVEEFRAHTRERMETEAQLAIKDKLNERAVQALTERFEGKIDDIWYEATRDGLRESYEEQARQQGKTLDDMIREQGIDRRAFDAGLMMQVRDMLKQGACLDAWARHYQLECADEDVLEIANMMTDGRGAQLLQDLREAKDEDQLEGLRVAARRLVANKDLVKTAIIK